MGALGGHMAHLSEDLDLTFNEIVEVLGKVANAEIEAVTEKVDGQNLFLTVTESGDIRAARNNSDVAAGGMTTEEYASKWRGHPAESAFTNGFKAISTALRKLSPETLEDVFADGDRYVVYSRQMPVTFLLPEIESWSDRSRARRKQRHPVKWPVA